MSFLQSAAGSPRVEHLEKLDQVVSMATTLGSPLPWGADAAGIFLPRTGGVRWN